MSLKRAEPRTVVLSLGSSGVAPMADELLAHGRVRQAYLGLQPAPLTAEIARELHVTGGGVLVYVVASEGPADRAGLRPGDVLTAIGSAKIAAVEELFAALRQHRPGESVSVAYVRGGETRAAQAQITDRPSDGYGSIRPRRIA
jgi:serine protease DegQ